MTVISHHRRIINIISGKYSIYEFEFVLCLENNQFIYNELKIVMYLPHNQ